VFFLTSLTCVALCGFVLQPPTVFCHPQSNWYHQREEADVVVSHKCTTPGSSTKKPLQTAAAAGAGAGSGSAPSALTSTYFIGLSFVSGLQSANINPEINVSLRI
jgi:hypothetical protein